MSGLPPIRDGAEAASVALGMIRTVLPLRSFSFQDHMNMMEILWRTKMLLYLRLSLQRKAASR